MHVEINIHINYSKSNVVNFNYFFFHRHKRAETNACYPEVGCFDTSGPYGYIGMVPNRPDEVKRRSGFFLFFNLSRIRKTLKKKTPSCHIQYQEKCFNPKKKRNPKFTRTDRYFVLVWSVAPTVQVSSGQFIRFPGA